MKEKYKKILSATANILAAAIVSLGTYIVMGVPMEELTPSKLFILGISSVLVGNAIFKYTELE